MGFSPEIHLITKPSAWCYCHHASQLLQCTQTSCSVINRTFLWSSCFKFLSSCLISASFTQTAWTRGSSHSACLCLFVGIQGAAGELWPPALSSCWVNSPGGTRPDPAVPSAVRSSAIFGDRYKYLPHVGCRCWSSHWHSSCWFPANIALLPPLSCCSCFIFTETNDNIALQWSVNPVFVVLVKIYRIMSYFCLFLLSPLEGGKFPVIILPQNLKNFLISLNKAF